jgi:predicted nucleic acid-binding protein
VEAIQEAVHFFRKRGVAAETIAVFDYLVDGFPEAFSITAATMLIARDVLEANSFLQARDAIHAAVVIQNGLEGIISTDRAFDRVSGLRRFDPVELAA